MIRGEQDTRDLAARAIALTLEAGATQAEALTVSGEDSLTRFANNRIHQNVASADSKVSVRAVLGKRVGVASTNRTEEESLRECCRTAVEAARHAPEDPDFPGLPAPEPVAAARRVAEATRDSTPKSRAAQVEAIVDASVSRGLTAAGTLSRGFEILAIANSLGVDAAMAYTTSRATVLSMGPDHGSGWASFSGRDLADLDPAPLGEAAASLALRSAGPVELAPGDYTVVLAPEAVADIVQFLGWFGCSAKAVEEGRSFMTGHLGQRVVSELITIFDDALADGALGPTFDYEGMPSRRTPLIVRGTAVGPVTDSYWAAKTGRPNTGHALPAPNGDGPLPLHLAMEAGDSDPDAMIASVKRGVYVTRFHYTNIEDPVRAVLTGMTRDGTFLIENGSLTRPVKNLRFTCGAIDALDTTLAVSTQRQLVGEEGGALAPYLLLERFTFTGQTS
jgi:predicted Zn-dependent protease